MDSSLLIALAAGFAALAALASLVAASKALSLARHQAKTLDTYVANMEKSRVLRDIAHESREAIDIGRRVEKLAVESVALRRSLAIQQGGLGSERQRHFDEEVSNLSHQVAAAIEGLNGIFDAGKPVASYDLGELDDIHAQMSQQRGEVNNLLKQLELMHTGLVAALAPFDEIVTTAPAE
jgi:hypothetical protein